MQQRRYLGERWGLSAHTLGLRNRAYVVRRWQPPLLGRDRNQESKSKSRSRSRREEHLCNAAARTFTCCSRVNVCGQVGEIIAARCVRRATLPNEYGVTVIYISLSLEQEREWEREEEHATIRYTRRDHKTSVSPLLPREAILFYAQFI